MIIGILSLRNHRYHPNRRLMEAARHLGHDAVLIHPKRLFLSVADQELHLGQTKKRGIGVDVMVPRIGAPIREYPLTLIRQVQKLGIPVVNRFEAILLARNKFLTLQTLQSVDVSVPDSAYASNESNFRKAVSALGGFPLILKRPYSRQGKGVALVHSYEEAGPLLEDLFHSGQGFLVQHYIPPETRRDLRLLVVGGKITGAVSLRPKRGEFRANIHLRARAEVLDMTDKMAELALKSTEALGLDISGVDMIEEGVGSLRVIDVNYAPGFRGMEKCTGIDIAGEIVKYVINLGSSPQCRSLF